MTGRTAILHLLPFSQREYRPAQPGANVDQILYLRFHPCILDQDLDLTQALGDYFATYVERDVRGLGGIRTLSGFETFTSLAAGRIGQTLNLSKPATRLGHGHDVSRPTSTIESPFVPESRPLDGFGRSGQGVLWVGVPSGTGRGSLGSPAGSDLGAAGLRFGGQGPRPYDWQCRTLTAPEDTGWGRYVLFRHSRRDPPTDRSILSTRPSGGAMPRRLSAATIVDAGRPLLYNCSISHIWTSNHLLHDANAIRIALPGRVLSTRIFRWA